MKKINLKTNYIYSAILQLTTILVPLITAPYTSRVFGPEGVGAISHTGAILSMFTLFAVLGTQTYGQKAIAQRRDDKEAVSKIFWEIELLSVFTTLIVLIGWGIMVAFAKEYKGYYLVYTIMFLTVAADIRWLYYGFEEFKGTNLRAIITKLVGVICLFAFAKTENDILLYLGLVAATDCIGNLILWIPLHKYICRVKISTLRFGEHLKNTLVFFVPTIAVSIYTLLDKAMLGWFMDSSVENGYYEQTTNIVKLSLGLANAHNAIMIPRMSYLYSRGEHEKIKEAIHISLQVSLLLTIPMVFGLDAVASKLIPIYLGDEFLPVINLMYVYSLLVIPIAISCCIDDQLFIATGKNRHIIASTTSGAVLNLILNLILIPQYKAMGATVSSVISEVYIATYVIIAARGTVSFGRVLKECYKKVLAGGLMFVAVYEVGTVMPESILTLVLMVLVGVVVYFVLLFILRDNMCSYVTDYVKDKLHLNKGVKE